MPSRVARLGCGVLFLGILLAGLWIAGEIAAARAPLDSPHHPFRSAQARERFLELYDREAARWPVPSETRWVATDFGETFVRVSGREGGSPVVLLHGIGGSSLQWIDNVEALAARHRVYAVDNVYDYGRSVYRREMKGADDFVTWLAELLETLEPGRRVHLVGLSYGGWIAAHFALTHPDRVHGLVLVAPVSTVQPLAREWMARAALCALPHPVFTERFMLWLAEDLARTEAGRRRIGEQAAYGHLAVRSFRPRPLVPPTVMGDAELARLPETTLYLVGENEKIYPAPLALDRLARVAPQVQTQLVEEAGHDLTLVRAAQVDRSILDFLAGLEPLDR